MDAYLAAMGRLGGSKGGESGSEAAVPFAIAQALLDCVNATVS